MNYDLDYLKQAHTRTAGNREEIKASVNCGCCYCLSVYPSSEIENWIEDVGGSAMCPNCAVDSVIGDASGLPVTDQAFLSAMHKEWFEKTTTLNEFKALERKSKIKRFFGLTLPKGGLD